MAEKTQEKTVDLLNTLLSTNVNAREGYRTAADNVDDSDLKTFFNTRAQNRATLVSSLEKLIRDAGGTPNSSGTTAGKAHRGWINARSSLSGGSPETLLSECERGEEHAISQYEDAVKDKKLPQHLRDSLEDQLEEVRSDLSALQEKKATVS